MSKYWKHDLREARAQEAFDVSDFDPSQFTVTRTSFEDGRTVVETMSMEDLFSSSGGSPMAETAGVRNELWEWFTDALAYTLFTLPANSRLMIGNVVGGETDRFARFLRFDEFLMCETALAADSAQSDPQRRRGSVDMWNFGEWAEPQPEEGMDNWFRMIPWPGAYAEFRAVAAATVEAFRFVSSAEWPQELACAAFDLETDADIETRLLDAEPVDGEIIANLPEERLRNLLGIHREIVEVVLAADAAGQNLRIEVARSRAEHAEVLVLAEGDRWPAARERTLDLIAQTGPASLLAVDVVLDVPADADVSDHLVLREFGEDSAYQGSREYLDGMLAADPDFAAALETRPALAAAMRAGTVDIGYELIAVREDGDYSVYRYL
ncbi:TY-Chap domain-containing protein [Nocardia sp. NPDC003693]